MDKKQRRRLKRLLAELDTGERNKLTKRAAKLRKAALRTQKPGDRRPELEDFLLELVDRGPRGRTGRRAGGPSGRGASAAEADLTGVAGDRGVVTGIAAAACLGAARREPPGEDVAALLSPELAGRQQSDLAVGDHVLVERRGDTHRVTAVLPRRSLLARADPHVPRRRRAIAANIDAVVVVVATQAPPLHPRLIDRYLVAVEQSGARPVLVVNKTDLLDERGRHELLARLQPYRSLGMPVLPCSAGRGEGVEAVREALAGATCVFVGQSGVGKSSLLNALDGEADAKIGAVRDGDGRGRHTTTASALYDLPGGIRVIDTPGIRRFSVEDGDVATLAAGFTELATFADRSAASATAPTCTSPAAPSAAPSPTARSRAAATELRQAARWRRRRPATPRRGPGPGGGAPGGGAPAARWAARRRRHGPLTAPLGDARPAKTAPPDAYARRGGGDSPVPAAPRLRHSARSASRATNCCRCSESHAGSTSRWAAGRGPVLAKRAAPAPLAETE